MLPISSGPDMNSSAARLRSHRGRIRASNHGGLVEPADQRKQCSVGNGLVPVVECSVEWRLAPHGADDSAEGEGRPQQWGKAWAEADAAKGGENHQNDDSQTKANQHLGRSEFSR